MSKFIYFHLELFKIMGWDRIFNETRVGQIFVLKKLKGWE